MLFNSDPSRAAQEVLFSKKKKIQIHHKHLGILLDEKLNFIQHIDTAIFPADTNGL